MEKLNNEGDGTGNGGNHWEEANYHSSQNLNWKSHDGSETVDEQHHEEDWGAEKEEDVGGDLRDEVVDEVEHIWDEEDEPADGLNDQVWDELDEVLSQVHWSKCNPCDDAEKHDWNVQHVKEEVEQEVETVSLDEILSPLWQDQVQWEEVPNDLDIWMVEILDVTENSVYR